MNEMCMYCFGNLSSGDIDGVCKSCRHKKNETYEYTKTQKLEYENQILIIENEKLRIQIKKLQEAFWFETLESQVIEKQQEINHLKAVNEKLRENMCKCCGVTINLGTCCAELKRNCEFLKGESK